MRNEPLIPHDHAARLIEDALRLRVGRGKRHSFTGLADATGIPARTLESYVQGATPGLAGLLTLCAVLGPSFTSDVLAPTGLSATDGSEVEPEYPRALTVLSEALAALAAALEDGHVDHREKAVLKQAMEAVAEVTAPMMRCENVEPISKRAG